jgi:molecular chaperone HtpG
MDPKMESILRAMGQDVPANKRILEINPSHPVFEAMSVLLDKDGANPVLQEYTDLLYNEALLLEGSKPKDPASFAKVISKLILENTKQFKG